MCITPSPAHTQRIYSPELLRKLNSDQSSKIQRDVRKKLFRLRIWSPRHKYENKITTENSKSNITENVMVKTVNTTSVSDVRLGVMNVSSLGNKMDCVIDHITDNKLDIVGITETWLSNNDKNNMLVMNTCLDSGYTLHHRPRNTGRKGGGVGVLINNRIKHQSRILHDKPEIMSFESIELVITLGSVTILLSVIYRMPPVKSKNGLKQGEFCNEFNDYLEKLSCMNGNIVIVGDFNIDWLNTNGSERKRFYNILKTFGFVQNICTETHRSHHLLDYIITRKDCNIISDCTVSDFISDHRVLHASLQCIRPIQFEKQITVRALRRIKDDALAEDLDRFYVDQGCVDVDIIIEQYDKYLSDLLDKHAPKKHIYVVDRPLNEWMTDDILKLKAIRRKNELIWRKTRTTINFDIYYESCKAVKKAISKRKSELMEQRVIDCEGDQKKLFSLIHSLHGSKKNTVLPEYTSSFTLASTINMFFIDKINTIKMEFPLLEACLPVYSFVDIDIIMPACTAVFDTFHPLSCDVLSSLISKLNKTTCMLDPFPTKLLMSHLFYIIDIILCIVNLWFSSGVFPTACKSSIIFPLIKKQGLDPEILKNYRPVANLSFISKIIEKAIATQIHDHLINNDIVDNFQSAYKAGHSCETALLRVYNDIVTTIGKGNGAMLVLLDLSAAFDTIDHDNLFCILEKYVGIRGNALKLIKSYFSNRTQRVQIDDVLSDFANIICGVPQGSVLGPLKFCLYLLPMSAILKYHKIALISCRLDYCNSLLYNVPTHKTDRLQRLQNQCARILTKSPCREHITPVLKSLHWLKIQDRITYKILMLTYKSYYNIAPTYLCELISRRESYVNTRLGSDQHQLIMPPISKDCSNTFLDRSFIYAAPCEWNKLSECIRTSSFDSFRKSVKTMLFTQQYG